MPKYSYVPLDKWAGGFRLLQIRKDPHTHQPQYTLQNFSLINCPDFIALSYTWGNPTPTVSVEVDWEHLEVRQNLFDFLHACTTEPWGMSGTGKPSFYWIDQICINQDDPIERSNQVRIMDKIYKKAKMVLIWLGCDPTMMEAARWVRDRELDQEQALDTLLAHPYFSRIWIVQEIVLSVNSPLIVCGGIELDWDRLILVEAALQPVFTVAVRAILFGREPEKWRTLEGCISTYYEGNCHDPRDKVYALLGLTPERWRVRIDYTKEVLEVYFDAVAALYEELFDLTDPECLYPEYLTDSASPGAYRKTLFSLAISMKIRSGELGALQFFLEDTQAAYLGTKVRDVQYTYTGRIYTRVRAQSSSEHVLAEKEEEELEVSWGSIPAVRRKPLMRDIIPEMGLQLAKQSGDSAPVRDRWWYKHEGKIHYIFC